MGDAGPATEVALKSFLLPRPPKEADESGNSETIVTGSSEKVIASKDIPLYAYFKESETIYPRTVRDRTTNEVYDLDIVTRDYRGVDNRSFSMGKNKVEDKKWAMVVVRDKGTDNVLGTMTSGAGTIKVSFSTHSQHPSINIHLIPVKGLDEHTILEPELRWTISPHSVTHDELGLGLAFAFPENSESMAGRIPRTSENLRQRVNDKSLLEVELRLDSKERPHFTGMPLAKLTRIFEKAGNGEVLTERESTIVALEAASRLSLYLSVSPQADPAGLKGCARYLRSTFFLCRTQGYFWFYQMQAPTQRLEDPEFPFEEMVVPRWMVTSWIATMDKDNTVMSIIPQSWASVEKLEDYPTPYAFAFALRLGVARERQHQLRQLGLMFDSDKGSIRATFQELPDNQGTFLVAMMIYNLDNIKDPVLPEVETRVVIKVQKGKRTFDFTGQIIEDHFNMGAHITAVVSGPRLDLRNAFHDVQLVLLDDPTSLHRCISAVELLLLGHANRTVGIDLLSYAFNAPATIERTGYLAEEVEGSPEKMEKVKEALNLMKAKRMLNDQQEKIVFDQLETFTGDFSIQGPPGTGKTVTCEAAAHAHVLLGRKVLVVAPSNEPVQSAIAKYKALRRVPASSFVHFKGAFSRLTKAESLSKKLAGAKDEEAARKLQGLYMDQSLPAASTSAAKSKQEQDAENKAAETEADLECIRAVYRLIAEEAGLSPEKALELEDAYNVKLHKKIIAISQDYNDPKKDLAQEYLDLKTALKEANRTDTARIDTRLEVLEANFNKWYLGEHVDVVFSTCSASCHSVLMENFQPEVIIIEEAAIGT